MDPNYDLRKEEYLRNRARAMEVETRTKLGFSGWHGLTYRKSQQTTEKDTPLCLIFQYTQEDVDMTVCVEKLSGTMLEIRCTMWTTFREILEHLQEFDPFPCSGRKMKHQLISQCGSGHQREPLDLEGKVADPVPLFEQGIPPFMSFHHKVCGHL